MRKNISYPIFKLKQLTLHIALVTYLIHRYIRTTIQHLVKFSHIFKLNLLLPIHLSHKILHISFLLTRLFHLLYMFNLLLKVLDTKSHQAWTDHIRILSIFRHVYYLLRKGFLGVLNCSVIIKYVLLSL